MPTHLVLNKNFGIENLTEVIKTLLEGSNSKETTRHTDNSLGGQSPPRIRHPDRHIPVGPVYSPSIYSCYSLSVLAYSLVLEIGNFAVDPLYCHLEHKRQEHPKPSFYSPLKVVQVAFCGKWIKGNEQVDRSGI